VAKVGVSAAGNYRSCEKLFSVEKWDEIICGEK